eukprot:3845625-Prymnesium_polylepis.2
MRRPPWSHAAAGEPTGRPFDHTPYGHRIRMMLSSHRQHTPEEQYGRAHLSVRSRGVRMRDTACARRCMMCASHVDVLAPRCSTVHRARESPGARTSHMCGQVVGRKGSLMRNSCKGSDRGFQSLPFRCAAIAYKIFAHVRDTSRYMDKNPSGTSSGALGRRDF